MVPQVLPQDCNHLVESLKKKGQCEKKVHYMTPVSRTVFQRGQPRAL